MREVIEYAVQDSVDRGDGIETVQFSNPPLDGQTFTMGTTAFPPGTSLREHSHNTIEQVTLLEGTGIVEINGRIQRLSQYDTTRVPAGEPHRFENDGDTVMRILWVYGSTDVTRTFLDTGETVSNHAKPTG